MAISFFYHENNLDGKIRSDYKGIGTSFSAFKHNHYESYKTAHLGITGITRDDIVKKATLLSNYLHNVDVFIDEHASHNIKITSQSKFRPTVLEEFCGFLFKDLPEVSTLGLGFFNKAVFAGIVLDRNGNAKIKTKDIDFCIGKQFDVTIGTHIYEIIIPIIAIECKTYIDKTMFSESQFTAQKMKQGSPNVRVYVVSEQNQIDREEIPTKGQTPIDQIFIIRGSFNEAIKPDAVFAFFEEVRKALVQISHETVRREIGGILPD